MTVNNVQNSNRSNDYERHCTSTGLQLMFENSNRITKVGYNLMPFITGRSGRRTLMVLSFYIVNDDVNDELAETIEETNNTGRRPARCTCGLSGSDKHL